MSATTAHRSARSRRLLPLMARRHPHEPHRTATPLELLFDLVFVVAVAFAGRSLLGYEEEGHLAVGILGYAMAFAAIWWAWMNFTWFATSYDTDDWYYRILTIVQMGGALTFAAGIPGIANPEHPDFTLGVTGYLIMRLAMVAQWLRAAASDAVGRKTALAYAIGITVVQVYWVIYALTLPPGATVALFWLGMALELSVPVVAERFKLTEWHRHHITERYSGFTIIVLGESILAAATAVAEVRKEADPAGIVLIAVTGLVIVASMWWIYFALPQHELLTNLRQGLFWGYGHFVVFASAAAVAGGIEISLLTEQHHLDALSSVEAAATLTVPVALYVLMVWLLVVRPQSTLPTHLLMPLAAVLIGFSAFLPGSAQITAGVLVALVAFLTIHTVPHRTKHLD
ncbi:low temperature requirement protein A [Psychromicrobium xiongbiense]|uniref:low temperature requirement protein A n=1 Tax=Psychromicrobium xiongbiense TaxID=3051184 RepID=UPI002552804D|nr:low temperature requirement protein A [Psychromicrobium sp. YIM S02556]